VPSAAVETEVSKMVEKYKIGRDARTGKFISVSQAENRKKTVVVETMSRSHARKKKRLFMDSELLTIMGGYDRTFWCAAAGLTPRPTSIHRTDCNRRAPE